MDVGCSLKLFVASTMTPQTIHSHPHPNFQKITPLTQVLQCKGAPICPSTAYQEAKTLCIHMMGPRGDSYSHIYQYAPAELLLVRYGEVAADGLILVPTSFLQV